MIGTSARKKARQVERKARQRGRRHDRSNERPASAQLGTTGRTKGTSARKKARQVERKARQRGRRHDGSNERHVGAEEGTTGRTEGTSGRRKARRVERKARQRGGRHGGSDGRHVSVEEGTTGRTEGTSAQKNARPVERPSARTKARRKGGSSVHRGHLGQAIPGTKARRKCKGDALRNRTISVRRTPCNDGVWPDADPYGLAASLGPLAHAAGSTSAIGRRRRAVRVRVARDRAVPVVLDRVVAAAVLGPLVARLEALVKADRRRALAIFHAEGAERIGRRRRAGRRARGTSVDRRVASRAPQKCERDDECEPHRAETSSRVR